NFTYIVALRPKIAFIIDIRRQNLIQHLMYKALIEMATDRADFLSHLFSRPRPAKLGKDSTVTDLFDAYRAAEMDEHLYEGRLASVEKHLIKDHGFDLSTDDQTVLSYIMKAFAIGGTSLGYPGPQRSTSPRILPTYEELMVDIDDDGRQQSYLATEDN